MDKKTKIRTEGEINDEISTLTARADELEAKAQGEAGLTPEESDELAAIVAKLQELGQERTVTESRIQLSRVKEQLAQPTTPAPAIPATYKRSQENDPTEGLRLWIRSQFNQYPLTPRDYSVMQAAGFIPGKSDAAVPYDMSNLNRRRFKRTKLSTGGSGTGTELTYKTYSDKVVEYFNYSSPFVTALSSEVVSDGNSERTFHRLDPTSLISTKTSASGGSETSPTIPDVNPTTSKVVIKPFAITSGRFTVTYEMAQSSKVNVVDKLAEWCALSDQAYIENLVLNDTGNGSNGGVAGIMATAQAFTPTASGVVNIVEELYFKIPKQYRDKAVFVCNDVTMAYLTSNLKDGVERSLFDKNIAEGLEWDTFMGKPFYISRFMDDMKVAYFVPEFFQLVFGGSAELSIFKERYWPDRAAAQVSLVSGAYLGPTGSTGTVWSYEFDDS